MTELLSSTGFSDCSGSLLSHYFQEMKYYRFYFCKPDFNVYLCHVVQCEHCFLER